MGLERFRQAVSRRPFALIAAWSVAAVVVGLSAPSLTRLAAEGQANLLPRDAESARLAALVARTWPDHAYQSMAVVALHRPEALSGADEDYARRLAERFEAAGRPGEVLQVLGPHSPPRWPGG